jgi:hypothetical protein
MIIQPGKKKICERSESKEDIQVNEPEFDAPKCLASLFRGESHGKPMDICSNEISPKQGSKDMQATKLFAKIEKFVEEKKLNYVELFNHVSGSYIL